MASNPSGEDMSPEELPRVRKWETEQKLVVARVAHALAFWPLVLVAMVDGNRRSFLEGRCHFTIFLTMCFKKATPRPCYAIRDPLGFLPNFGSNLNPTSNTM